MSKLRLHATRLRTSLSTAPAITPVNRNGYSHRTVCHAAGEFARDEDGDGFCEVHVNTIEGFWSLLRSWLCPHRGISHEKSPLYLGFFEFLHNVADGRPDDRNSPVDGTPPPSTRPSSSLERRGTHWADGRTRGESEAALFILNEMRFIPIYFH